MIGGGPPSFSMMLAVYLIGIVTMCVPIIPSVNLQGQCESSIVGSRLSGSVGGLSFSFMKHFNLPSSSGSHQIRFLSESMLLLEGTVVMFA